MRLNFGNHSTMFAHPLQTELLEDSWQLAQFLLPQKTELLKTVFTSSSQFFIEVFMRFCHKRLAPLVSLLVFVFVNRVVLSSGIAFSQNEKVNSLTERHLVDLNKSTIEHNRDGCEYAPDEKISDGDQTEQCGKMAMITGAVVVAVAGHYVSKGLSWVDQKVTDSFNSDSSGSFSEGLASASADSAAKSGDAYYGDAGVARGKNSLFTPEEQFDSN